MTINEYLRSLEQMPHRTEDGRSMADVMADDTEIWSNNACRGYAITAMRSAGLDPDTIRKVQRCMSDAFNDYTLEQAEEIYRKN